MSKTVWIERNRRFSFGYSVITTEHGRIGYTFTKKCAQRLLKRYLDRSLLEGK